MIDAAQKRSDDISDSGTVVLASSSSTFASKQTALKVESTDPVFAKQGGASQTSEATTSPLTVEYGTVKAEAEAVNDEPHSTAVTDKKMSSSMETHQVQEASARLPVPRQMDSSVESPNPTKTMDDPSTAATTSMPPSSASPQPSASTKSQTTTSSETTRTNTQPSKEPVATLEHNLDPADPVVKSLKERFNYASFDCGALILSVSPGTSSASSILRSNKDQYMLSKCVPKSQGAHASRYVTVELCDNILIEVIALANFEYFSSNFREFKVLVSEKYPPKDNWKSLGTFLASNVRGVQYFSVKNPLIFARYMRIEFLSHYGNEYYCPVTMLRVYGTTEMEAFKAEEEELARLNAVEEAEAIAAVAAVAAVARESVQKLGTGFTWTNPEFLHGPVGKRLYPEIDAPMPAVIQSEQNSPQRREYKR
ncbi:hypothetical protein HDU96_000030 [Phlyctochytrium bullatum]|nr:hypothetical protein HDU96_000030 [Phlyctochytrium bullatum]